MLLTIGLTINLLSASYTEIAMDPLSIENILLTKRNVRTVLAVLEDREKSTRDFSGGLGQTIQGFNELAENDGADSCGILMKTISSDPLSDMRINPGAVVIISALSHVVNFPYDFTAVPLPYDFAVPQYKRVGEGKVVFGTFHLENFAKAMQIARSVQESTPAMLDEIVEGGQFQSFADVLTTYNAFKAYLNYFVRNPVRSSRSSLPLPGLELDEDGNLYLHGYDKRVMKISEK